MSLKPSCKAGDHVWTKPSLWSGGDEYVVVRVLFSPVNGDVVGYRLSNYPGALFTVGVDKDGAPSGFRLEPPTDAQMARVERWVRAMYVAMVLGLIGLLVALFFHPEWV